MFTLVLSDEFLYGFSKLCFFKVKICILIWYFWVILENYSMCILSHSEHKRKRFHRTLSKRWTNFRVCSASVQISTVFTWTSERMLSICGNDFIACWAYSEWISSHAEHSGNDFNPHWAYSETISSHAEHTRNQYNATNCLESRMGKRTGDKERRRMIGNRGRETRNKEVRYGTEDGRQETKKWDMEQRMGRNKEQRSETGNRGWETRNIEVRHGTEDGRQGTKKWDIEQRRGDKGRETRNRKE